MIKAVVKIISKNQILKDTFKRIAMVFPTISKQFIELYRSNEPVYDPVIDEKKALEELDWYQGKKKDIEICGLKNEKEAINVYYDFSAIVNTPYTTGIQRVSKSLYQSTRDILNNTDRYYVCAIYSELNSFLFYRCKLDEQKRYVKQSYKEIENVICFKEGDVLLLTDTNFDHIVAKKKLYNDLMNNGVKVFAVVYDLIPIEYPQFYSREVVHIFELYLETISTLSGVMAISQVSLEQYKIWLAKKNIYYSEHFYKGYFHLGCDFEQNRSGKSMSKVDFDLIDKLTSVNTFLVVGTIEPRKCHTKILDAFEVLWKKGECVNLVFVGKYGWHMDEIVKRMIRHKENGKHFFWLQGIDDDYLEQIYMKSVAVIQASLQEGFGLPLVEASYYGKPIIARDIPVFREIVGDNAYYFTDDSPDQLAQTILDWLELYDKGMIHSSEDVEILNWKDSAKELIRQIQLGI